MNISGTDQAGRVVNIVEVIPNGNQIYTVYKDSSNNLKVDRLFLSGNGTVIATGVGILS